MKKAEPSQKKTTSDTYNEFKEFEGQKYTGMKVGRRHKWYYDEGEWSEIKTTPDLWEIHYDVKKRRAGKAPLGSGVPEGTEYHWYILAHQNVVKLDANVYETSMSGLKLKLAHKRAGSQKWSATENAQKKHLIDFLEGIIEQLRSDLKVRAKPKKVNKEPLIAKKKAVYQKTKAANKKRAAA